MDSSQTSTRTFALAIPVLTIACAVIVAFVFFYVSGDGLSAEDRRLLAAIDQGNYEAVRAALAAGADPNAKAVARTPLMAATAGGHLKIVEVLLQQPSILVNESAYGGFTAMDASLQCIVQIEGDTRSVKIAQPEIAKLLRARGALTLVELRYNAPSEQWISYWPEKTITGIVVALHEDHIEVQDDEQVRHPVMGKTVQQMQLNDQVVVTGHSYPFAPIELEGTVWANSIEKAR